MSRLLPFQGMQGLAGVTRCFSPAQGNFQFGEGKDEEVQIESPEKVSQASYPGPVKPRTQVSLHRAVKPRTQASLHRAV